MEMFDVLSDFDEREIDILSLAAAGYSNNEIAKQLFISIHTVKAHLSKIFRKLNAVDRTNAVFIAAKAGVLKDIEPYTSTKE